MDISWDMIAYFGSVLVGWALMEYLKRTFFPEKKTIKGDIVVEVEAPRAEAPEAENAPKKKTKRQATPRRSKRLKEDIIWHGSASAPGAPKRE